MIVLIRLSRVVSCFAWFTHCVATPIVWRLRLEERPGGGVRATLGLALRLEGLVADLT
jgi:hypothetical protein